MRPRNVNRDGDIWLITPDHHKTEDKGRSRVICLGERGRRTLAPYLLRGADDYCFSPKEVAAELNRIKRENRKTKVQPSQRSRAKKRRDLQIQIGDFYRSPAFNHAVRKACEKAGVKRWSLSMLRHKAATRSARPWESTPWQPRWDTRKST